jgi:hypothetical protein
MKEWNDVNECKSHVVYSQYFFYIVSNLVKILNCPFLYIIYSIFDIFVSCIYFPTNKETNKCDNDEKYVNT